MSRLAAGTQTEPRPGLLRQLVLCLLANQVSVLLSHSPQYSVTHHPQDYRTRRASEARGRGVIVNSSSRIDRTARLMFPLSFTAFNILYWLSYSQVTIIRSLPFPLYF